MSKPYLLPGHLEKLINEDEALRKIRVQGQQMNAPIVAFYQAITTCLLDRQRFLFIELGRYRQQYGELEPIETNDQSEEDREST